MTKAQPHAPAPPASPTALDLADVRALAEPLCESRGIELVDVEWASGPAGRILRVTIDREILADEDVAGLREGVTLDDCVGVSRELSRRLDEQDPAADASGPHYNLEVTSPGLDRPLRSARDFRRQVGRLAKVKLRAPAADGQRVLRGTITAVLEPEAALEPETVALEVDGKRHEVTLSDIAEARLVFEIPSGKKSKPGKQPNKSSARKRKNKRKGPAPQRSASAGSRRQ